MPVCKVGCDGLFENGYLIVNSNGEVCRNGSVAVSTDLETILTYVEGNICTRFNEQTEEFFTYSRESYESL